MKNLMIYISPTGSFNNPRRDLKSNDAGSLVKIQIENSLQLGWKKEDIVLVTNFEYQYGDFKAIAMPDLDFFKLKPQGCKITATASLFEKGLIKKNELYWLHDLDAYQLVPFKKNKIQLKKAGMAITKYSAPPKWNGASIFFNSGSKKIFLNLKKIMYEEKQDDEVALKLLTMRDAGTVKHIKEINCTYCFQPAYNFKTYYSKATKPIRIAHFHPFIGYKKLNINNLLAYFKGENELNIPLIPDRLTKIFKYHRIG